MSKRGRRRSSKRRKSSSSSKQSASQYSFQKQNKSNSVSYKDDIAEKGETDSLRKENVLSGSEEEDKYNNAPPREKRVKRDYHVNSFTNQRSIYTKTTEDAERGVRTVTSVLVSDVGDSPPKIIVQQSCVLLSGHPPETSIMKMNCTGSHVKVEIQEASQLNASGIKTTFVLLNEKGERADVFVKSRCEKTWSPSNESSEQPSQSVTQHNGNQNSNYRFTFGNMSEQTESHSDIVSPSNHSHCCGDHRLRATDFMLTAHPSGTRPLLNIQPQGKRNNFDKSIRSDQFWEIPPPQEFADFKYNNLEDLTHCLASCRIGAQSQKEFHPTPNITDDEESPWPCSLEAEERADMAASFHQLSDPASHEPVLMRPSSFTKDFINCRINSIATVEHRARASAKKRHQTYPGTSEGLGFFQEDFLSSCPESFSSLVVCSLLLQTDKFSAFGGGNYNSSQNQGRSKLTSEPRNSRDGKQSLLSSFYMTSSEAMPDDVFTVNEQCRRERSITYHHKGLRQQKVDFKQNICMEVESLENTDQSEVADSGFDQEMGEVEYHSPEALTELSQRAFGIQVIPPSSRGSEEQILQSHPVPLLLKDQVESQEDPVSVSQSESSVMTVTVGAQEQRFLQMDSGSSLGVDHCGTALEDPCMSPLQEVNSLLLNTSEDTDEIEPKPYGKQAGNASPSLPIMQTNDLQLNPERRTEDSEKPAVTASCPAKGSTDADIHGKEQLTKTDTYTASRSPLEDKEHLKPVVHKDPDSSGSDQWTRRRTLFKESKEWSSAGGSSMTSDITEESVSEDARSMDMTAQDNEDRGFYTETFHSSAWIYQGDNVDAAAVPPKTRAVSIRERTVKISRGTGEYPWGFRTQFSKPIVVTEVDTNGAAEEAGLMVGDSVLAVNGTDVTSAAHSEATDLARQGPDVLTLTIGSDIARGPNTPRPACRGYLHKRTQSGLFKGWRKRWFVLTHGCCLFYYRHKRDEGKRRALFAVKLEGAEVGPDVSLGKPFVFRCRPQPGSRVYFLCATSNQEMKRWLGAMEKALHPITQNHVWMDVTRHNSNLPPLAVKTPECLGLLHRYEKVKDTWVQHYCVLKDGCLYLYSGIRATHAYGGIYLQGYVVRELPYGSKKSTIELNPLTDEFKAFYLCAENPNENKRWITAIKASINKWLPLRSAFQEYMNRPSEETRK